MIALEPDRDGVCAVVRVQVLENVADVAFSNRILPNRKLGGDLLNSAFPLAISLRISSSRSVN